METTYIPRQGNRVQIMDDGPTFITGKVMGFGTSNGESVAIVSLDEPTWTEHRIMFISVIVVHFSNLRRIDVFS